MLRPCLLCYCGVHGESRRPHKVGLLEASYIMMTSVSPRPRARARPGIHESQALRYLQMFDPPPTDYVVRAMRRFVETLRIIPDGEGTLLELGCDNHFSLLLQEFTRYKVRTHNLSH